MPGKAAISLTTGVDVHEDVTVETAETHIEPIYTKTGAPPRSTATLFAMRQGLLDSLSPGDL